MIKENFSNKEPVCEERNSTEKDQRKIVERSPSREKTPEKRVALFQGRKRTVKKERCHYRRAYRPDSHKIKGKRECLSGENSRKKGGISKSSKINPTRWKGSKG